MIIYRGLPVVYSPDVPLGRTARSYRPVGRFRGSTGRRRERPRKGPRGPTRKAGPRGL